MFIICAYDVNEKRCNKVMKILKKYLFHIQNSVFEGNLTPKQFIRLKKELGVIVSDDDSIMFYISYNEKIVKRDHMGDDHKGNLNII